MSVIKELDRFADWREQHRPDITTTAVCVSPDTLRKVLRKKTGQPFKADEPMIYRGLTIRCIVPKKANP
jgi:hypothetical protein